MSTTNNSNVSALTQIVDGVVRDEGTALNRCAALIVAMYESEVTYSADAIAHVFMMDASKRTDWYNETLSAVSEAYRKALRTFTLHKASKKADKSEDDAVAQIAADKQLRAARAMFQRALSATYGLRKGHDIDGSVMPVIGVSASARKTGNITVTYNRGVSERGNIRELDRAYSCNDLIRIGDKLIAAAAGRVKEPRARNPQGNAMADGAKALASLLTNTPRKPIEDMAPELSSNMEQVLQQLFMRKFYDGNTFDKAAFNEWLAETSAVAAKPVKESDTPVKEGTVKASNGVTLAKSAAA